MDFSNLDFVAIVNQLLPGFLTASIVYSFTAHPKPTPFERVVQALIYTVLIQPFAFAVKWSCLFVGSNYGAIGTWSNEGSVAASACLAILFGFILVICFNNNLPHALLWEFVTKRTTAPSEWFNTFNTNKSYVYLHLKGGRRLYGWPQEWPDSSTAGHFAMANPEWILDTNERVPLYLVSVMLIRAKDVQMVEFEKSAEQQLASRQEIAAAENALVELQNSPPVDESSRDAKNDSEVQLSVEQNTFIDAGEVALAKSMPVQEHRHPSKKERKEKRRNDRAPKNH